MYCHEFFKTEKEARAFQQEQGFGALYRKNGVSSRDDYLAEAVIAGLTLDQMTEKPFCIAWKED